MRLKVKDNLFEEWGNLNAVSPIILQRYAGKYAGRYNGLTKTGLGRNSKVEIVKNVLDISHVYTQLLKYGLFCILRYNQDDLIVFESRYDEIAPIQLADYDALIDDLKYHERPNLQRTIKSTSGLTKYVSEIIKFLMKIYNKKKDEILARMDFQIVYPDEERKEKSTQRIEDRAFHQDVIHNGHKTPSNTNLNRSGLLNRLKTYLENKLITFSSASELPKDLVFLNPKTKFKFMNNVFIFGGAVYNSRMDNFLSGEPIYYYFYNEKRSASDVGSIIYELILDGSTLKVGNIYFSRDRSPSKNDLKTLDEILK